MNRVRPEPTLSDLLDLTKREVMLETNCHAIGTIQSFDPSTQSAKITINYMKRFRRKDEATGLYRDVPEPYPVLTECPVITLHGGDAALTMPINQGDFCLVMFNDRDMDTWITSGQVAGTLTNRLHSFSDAIALVGINPFNRAIQDYDPDRAVLRNNEVKVALSASKIEISNANKNLATILQSLITTLSGLSTINCVPGSPVTLSPAVIANLTTIASDLGELLE